MIELEGATRTYGAKVAVDALRLTIPPGELFAFLGPNGAGKTTTIKMLVGLLRPSGGSIRVCGLDVVSQAREASLQIGYVPDQPYLYEKLTGREFLRFIADMYGLDARVAKERVEHEIRRFELEDFADYLAESYSHGMKQRTVFASALLHDPAVLIVDEPMVGLDPHSARLVKNLLRAEARAGKTILMSTHTLHVAEEIADRIGILAHGRLRFLGTVSMLRDEIKQEHLELEGLYLELMSQNLDASQSG
ncbi:MAG: ABC transporter ATP-binding protein [Planctomycetales bacterium]|nr:ABC transporter ATP-binding protein [Planctomycetales bacterium]